MAIDSAEKRRSVAGVPFFVGLGVTPNVSKDQEWRQQAGYGYSGILAAAIAAPSQDITSTDELQIPVDYQIAEEKKVDFTKIQVVRSE